MKMLTMDELAVDGLDQQERLGLLVKSYLTGDPASATRAIIDAAHDPRGEVTALQSLVVTLAGALGGAWEAQATDKAELLARVDEQLKLIEIERGLTHE